MILGQHLKLRVSLYVRYAESRQHICTTTAVCPLPRPACVTRQNFFQAQSFFVWKHSVVFFHSRSQDSFLFSDLATNLGTGFISIGVFVQTLGSSLYARYEHFDSAHQGINITCACCCCLEEITQLHLHKVIVQLHHIFESVFAHLLPNPLHHWPIHPVDCQSLLIGLLRTPGSEAGLEELLWPTLSIWD